MFASVKALVIVATCALVAQAQSSASSTASTAPASQSSLPASLDPCILGCVTTAATSAGCGTLCVSPSRALHLVDSVLALT